MIEIFVSGAFEGTFEIYNFEDLASFIDRQYLIVYTSAVNYSCVKNGVEFYSTTVPPNIEPSKYVCEVLINILPEFRIDFFNYIRGLNLEERTGVFKGLWKEAANRDVHTILHTGK